VVLVSRKIVAAERMASAILSGNIVRTIRHFGTLFRGVSGFEAGCIFSWHVSSCSAKDYTTIFKKYQ
jgi:hypothetical protein